MKNLILAISSGLLLAFAWPTDGWAFLLFIAFVPLLLIVDNIFESKTKKKSLKVFAYSYLAFVIWNFYTTFWLRFADFYAGLFAVLTNSLLLSLIILIFYYGRKKLGNSISNVLLITLWISFESFHQNWDLSWPWLNLGNGFSEYYKWIQWYEFTGIFGGTFWIWIINIWVYKAYKTYEEYSNWRLLIIPSFKILSGVIIPIVYSYSIYNNIDAEYKESSEKTQVVITQPNLDPYSEKFKISDNILAKQLCSLAEEVITDSTEFVFGPETSMPSGMQMNNLNNEIAIRTLENFSRHYNINFITGATLLQWYKNEEEASEFSNKTSKGYFYDISNSAIKIDTSKNIEIYHKSKLVVGVEHMPFRNLIKPLLGDYIINLGGTVGTHITQKERSVFKSFKSDFKVAPIICYESVYGDFVTGYVKNGANLLAVITNDGWWGNSQGHKQHLSFSRLRAIENRRFVVRSANTGISAVVNTRGDIVKSLEYGVKGSFNYEVYKNDQLTIYSQFGDYIARVFTFISLLLMLYAISKKKGISY